MPTTEASCSARTNERSSGKPTSSGTSVDPGFEKSVLRPRSRSASKSASRTVTSLMREPYGERAPARSPYRGSTDAEGAHLSRLAQVREVVEPGPERDLVPVGPRALDRRPDLDAGADDAEAVGLRLVLD